MKLHFYIIFILGSIFAHGQEQFVIPKGTKSLGVMFNYSFLKEKGANTEVDFINHNFLFSPSFGYAIKNNLILGTQLRYILRREVADSDNLQQRATRRDIINRGGGIDVFIKKHITLNKALLFNVKANIGYQTTKEEDFNSSQDFRTHTFNVGITPGLTLSLSKRLALTADFGFIGYTNTKEVFYNDFTDTEKEERFDVDFSSFNLLVGLVYFIK